MFLSDEILIKNRLAAQLAGILGATAEPRVLSAAEMASIDERSQVTPCVYVVYDGHTPGADMAQGAIQEIEQRWMIVVTVRNARGAVDGQATREDAEPIIDATLQALMGWKPDSSGGALKMSDSPQPVYQAGYGYFPFAFTRRRTFRGA